MDYDYIFLRRHPRIIEQATFFDRAQKAYSGGAAYIETALIKHVSEVDPEYTERKERACYFNYPRKIARLISQFVFSKSPDRKDADPDVSEDFSRTGLRADEVMRKASTYLNCYGLAWLLVDMPTFSGDLDLETKKAGRIRPYCRALKPQSVPDWSYGADGRLDWAIVEEIGVDKSDPFKKPETVIYRRLWTRNSWILLKKGDAGTAELVDESTHSLGMVPLVQIEEVDGFGMDANHWFEDVVRISDAILNAESEAQMNVIKQMFGLLVVAESFRNGDFTGANDEGEMKFSHVLARSAAIWESAEEEGISRYIAPTGVETATIRTEIQNLKKELMDVVGLAVQSESKEAQTAESKAWDHQNVSQFLASRADMLEQSEMLVWQIMNRWDSTIKVPDVSYNREYAIIDLKDAVAAILEFDTINAGDEFKREVARAAVDLLGRVKRVDAETRKKIEAEIETLTEKVEIPESTPFG